MQRDERTPQSGDDRTDSGQRAGSSFQSVCAPALALPKGGGALRAIDEKFTVNALNGTCDLSVSLPFSKTRSGVDGAVALLYSSGSGNSAFGLGWSLRLPSISRRTDKRLPRYEDARESDVFVLAGAEDLVPAWFEQAPDDWRRDAFDLGNAHVERYRPRIEGAFAQIEKISIAGERGFYWKITTRENLVTIYGRTAQARLADPADDSRIFRWLPEWIYDDKGNCAQYVYKPEDLTNTPDVLEEKNRRGAGAFANTYLKRIRYGNTNPYFADPATPFDPAAPVNAGYLFETVFDYGDHDYAAPAPGDAGQWPCRFDPFSDCRSGFDIRTYRLCRRILFFHYFTELNLGPGPEAEPYLTRSVDLFYGNFHFDGAQHQRQETELLTRVERVHYRKTAPGVYARRSIPPLDLHYHDAQWSTTVETVSPEDVVHAPAGVSSGFTWIDLDGDGVPGILGEDTTAWYYKRNLGDGHFSRASAVTPKPSFAGAATGVLQFRDLDADGRRHVVATQPGLHGYFELDDDDQWTPFRAFETAPPLDVSDPNVKLLDLDGDGRADLLLSEEIVFRWYPSLGTRGFDAPQQASKAFDEERGPALVFADGTQTIFIADMNGDGLADIARVRNGEVCYWPSLGYGRFGAKVTMANSPLLDQPESFDPRAIQLVDISGTGAADLIYLGRGGFTAFLNLAGNGWSAAQTIDPFPGTERPNRVAVLDMLGNGTACLVWSSELPAHRLAPLRYVDLMGGRKPYILDRYANNLGMETRIEYRSSSYYALLDRSEGRPWITKLPFPTMCISRTEVRDSVSGALFVREYRYRHGYYDHEEREFRGFGMVEETEGETYDRFSRSGASNIVPEPLHQAPARTRTWYHTGAFVRGAKILHAFAEDYFANATVPEHALAELRIEGGPLTPREMREAARACKGTILRREVYADDGATNEDVPFTASTHNCYLRRVQPARGDMPAVFAPQESESLSYHYERDSGDPRTLHTLNTHIDALGNVVESAMVVYGRRNADLLLPQEVRDEQSALRVIYTIRNYTNDVRTNAAYRLRGVSDTQSFELTGATPSGGYFTPTELRGFFNGASPREFEITTPAVGVVEKRLIERERTRFASDADPNVPLAFGVLEPLGLSYESYRLAFTPSLLTSLYDARVTPGMLDEGDYAEIDGLRWVPGGTVRYPANPPQHFYLPDRYIDAHGATSTVRYYSNSHLLIDRVEDALGNSTTVLDFDLRVLEARSLRDVNENITETMFDILGLVVGIAHRGKGNQADDLAGFVADLTAAQTGAFFADPAGQGANLLQHATSRFVYRFGPLPAVAAAIDRETHHRAAQLAGVPSRLRYTFEYSDGLGHVAMQKFQAEPGLAKRVEVHDDGTYTVTDVDTTPNRRWVGNGRKVLNNKGSRVMEYEPYFSSTHAYESVAELVESGVTPLFHYDSLGRMVRTDYPDGSFARTTFDAWVQRTYDQNDCVSTSDWYVDRIGGAMGPFERDAALKTLMHDDTPSIVHLDSLGRPFYSVEHNRFADRVTGTIRNEHYATFTRQDIEGNRMFVRDPRNLMVMRWSYDFLGRADRVISMDAGEMRSLLDVAGKPLYTWDADGNRFHVLYDALLRPERREVLTSGGALLVLERSEYGANPATNANLKLVRHLDGSGISTHGPFDFRGNVLRTRREITADVSSVVDWTNPAAVAVRAPLTMENEYDALDRVVRSASADGSVTFPRYSEANLLGSLSVSVRGGAPRPFIDRILHNEKGQRLRIEYSGNRMVMDVTYDATTFRTRRIRTTRTSDGEALQNLNYTYDPDGNVTSVRDLAQQTLYFSNTIVEPHNDYTYDAIYRLVRATGREHVGQNAPVSRLDPERSHRPHRSDLNAMQRYQQDYEYDSAGNMTRMVHNAGTGALAHRWTRELVPRAANNQLVSSQVGATAEAYGYDGRGNMTAIPGLPVLTWDVHNRLGVVDLQGGGTARYAYDSDGQRVRKAVEHLGGLGEERVYAGALEIYTRTLNGALELRRETLHVLDGTQRLAMIDSRTDGPAEELIRFQFSNHVETASLELDELGQIITYEEYYPFGSTSYQAVDSTREVPRKRYRYTGRERDEETGLYYHGARYYAPWVARWTAADPSGVQDGINRYAYVNNHPTRLLDRTGRDGSEGSWWSRHGTRVIGGLQVLGGALEIAAGVGGLAAPTGVTQVLGAVAVVHGTDTLVTGLRTLWTGQVQESVTQQASTAAARGLGASESTARAIGVGVDLGAGVIPSAGVGIARAVATRTAVGVTTQTATHAAPTAVAHSAPAVAVEATSHAAPAVAVEATTHAVPAAATHAAPAVATHTAPAVAAHTAPTAVRATVTATARGTVARAGVRTATGTARGAGARSAARTLAEGGESALRVRIVDTLTRTVARQNIRLARAIAQRDVAYLRNLGLSQRAINRLFQGPGARLYAAIYGQALERAVRRAISSSPFLSQFFEFIGSRAGYVARIPGVRGGGRPDFRGLGIMEGILMDVTTLAGRAAHYARSYGERMMVMTYVR